MEEKFYELREENIYMNDNNYEYISIKDFLESIKNYGINIEDQFEGLNNYPQKNEIKIGDYLDAQKKLVDFMNQAIENLYNKLEGKPYYPRYNCLKYIIRIILIFIIIIFNMLKLK